MKPHWKYRLQRPIAPAVLVYYYALFSPIHRAPSRIGPRSRCISNKRDIGLDAEPVPMSIIDVVVFPFGA